MVSFTHNLFKLTLYTLLILNNVVSIAQIHPNKSYKIGIEDIEYYPHYGRKNASDDNYSGFARPLFDKFSNKNQLDFHYTPLPIKRLYNYFLNSQTVDFKYPDNPNWNIKNKQGHKVYYSDEITYYVDGTFIHQDQILPLDIVNLGVIRGFTPEPYLAQILADKIKVTEFSRSDHLLSALNHKRIDAAYMNVDVGKFQRSKSDFNLKVKFCSSLPLTKGSYYISTIKHPELLNKVNEFIRNNSDFIKELQLSYKFTVVD
jgi:polar amino acid transport system substrate-binding protein